MDSEAIKIAIVRAKLTIEMVPKTAWFSNDHDHVTASEWRRISGLVAEAAGYHCEICGSQGKKHRVECHEIWNYDDVHSIQKLSGLIALCPACHRVKHIGLTSAVGNVRFSIYHLARVNGWSEELAEIYVDVSVRIWRKRSEYDWKLDLSYIRENFNIRVEEKR